MAIFHSYVSHYQSVNPIKSHEEPPFSYGFPLVFLCLAKGVCLPLALLDLRSAAGVEELRRATATFMARDRPGNVVRS